MFSFFLATYIRLKWTQAFFAASFLSNVEINVILSGHFSRSIYILMWAHPNDLYSYLLSIHFFSPGLCIYVNDNFLILCDRLKSNSRKWPSTCYLLEQEIYIYILILKLPKLSYSLLSVLENLLCFPSVWILLLKVRPGYDDKFYPAAKIQIGSLAF